MDARIALSRCAKAARSRSAGAAKVLTATAFLFLAAQPASAANLVADYRFNDTRASSVGTPPSLTDVDTDSESGPDHDNVFVTETVDGSPRRVLRFPQSNGLDVSTAGVIPASSYSIVVRFRFASTTPGYRRIVDFKNRASDSGLYSHDGNLSFFPTATGTGQPIKPSSGGDPYQEAMLTRAASGLVVGYVNGAEQFRFNDSSGDAITHFGQSIAFFRDDSAVTGEQSAGAVTRIALYDGPVAPPPQLGKRVNVGVVSGRVLIAVPAGGSGARAAQKGVSFVPLTGTRQIPVRSLLDTSRGKVRLTSAADSKGKTQSGAFAGGLFQVLQARKAKAVTELRLKGASFRGCTARGARVGVSRRSRRTVRRLRATAKGRFRTRGRHSAATVRGTTWTTADRCDGTLTSVKRGKVAVRDFRRKRTVVVRAGKSYLARAAR